jgi:uncharacterized membrane protein YczE
LHSDHPDTSHLTGHFFNSQFLVSFWHSLPSCFGWVIIVLFWVPGPHGALQSSHLLNSQLTGHFLDISQLWVSWLGHSSPPLLAGVSTVLFWVPGPHGALQSSHLLNSQLTGHFLDISQLWVSWLGHSSPPLLAGVSTVLFWVPGPQSSKFSALHSDHSDTTHLTAGASSVLKNGMTTVATVLIKLKTPSPITAVVKRLLAGAGRPTLALTPAPPKGVVKSTLPPNPCLA